MAKYKNKDGISLNYTSNDVQTHLTKEVVGAAISMLKDSMYYDTYDNKVLEAIDFLQKNFNINESL
tara:strand:+ start:649 stop:846 length:198 start_codon:yes stop_codon:yes gene_type:complete